MKYKFNNYYKTYIAIILSLLMMIVTACKMENVSASNAKEKRKFEDSLGRIVEIDNNIDRVSVTGPIAQITAFPLIKDKLVGIAVPFNDSNKKIFDKKYIDLPVTGQLYGGKNEVNYETLITLNPNVIIDIGEAKENAAKELDDISIKTGIPCVHINYSLDSYKECYEKLGELLNEENKAKELIAYCDETIAKKNQIIAKVDKKNILYLLGNKGLNVIAEKSYFSGVLNMVANNVAKIENVSNRGMGNQVDLELIQKFNPSYIIFENKEMCEGVKNKVEWQEIKAIKDNNYFVALDIPYNVLGFPTAIQQMLGIRWLMYKLYPEYIDYDMDEEFKKFNKLFFDIDIDSKS